MRKSLKVIVPLVCVLVVGITFYMIFDIKNKVEEVNYGTNDIAVNEVVEDKENLDEIENTVLEENNVDSENTVVEEKNENASQEEVSEEEDNYSKNKFDEARNLVQKAWGEDNTVYFTNEGMNSEGLYMVAARDKTSTAVKNYFKVNLETKKVEVDY